MLLKFLDNAISVTSGAIVLVREGLQSICLMQGQHRNVLRCSGGFGVFFKLQFLVMFLLCDLSLCTCYRA